MFTQEQYQHLVSLHNQFITTDVSLIPFIDAVTATFSDKTSVLYQEWNNHINYLSEVTSGDLRGTAFPEPPAFPSVDIPGKDGHAADAISGLKDHAGIAKTKRLAKRAEKKLQLDGGGGVGPARHTRSDAEKRKGGRTSDALVDAVLLYDDEELKGSKKGTMYCIGCDASWSGQRNPKRIKKHVYECEKMKTDFPSLRDPIADELAKDSHSNSLEKLDAKSASKNRKENASKPATVDTAPPTGIRTFMSATKIPPNAKIHLEWLLFRMFICCALPWSLLDSPFFREFVHGINPAVEIPDRSAFFPKHLAQEVAAWTKKFAAFIADKLHLTLSLDGWSSRAKDEIYTFHTTTAMRRSFFTDGRVFKGESVTGFALRDVITHIFTTYDAKRYSAIAGDGGPNVRAAKVKISLAYPWILNVYDPCHNLNLYMKDLGKIFKDLLAVVSAIANYFGKSNYGTHHLNVQRKKDGVKVGIKSHSETRFSSSYAQVVSVKQCMGSIKKCLDSRVLKFDTAATKKLIPYIEDGTNHYDFMFEMTQFISLLESGANAIVTLEGQNITCADVFYVWVCIAFSLEEVLSKPGLRLGSKRAQITGTYNLRFNQMMNESSSKMFMLAYYLHPVFKHHGGLRITMPPNPDDKKLPSSEYPELFRTLLVSLLTILKGEQCRHEDSGEEAVPILVKEFTAYAYNQEPFLSHFSTWKKDSKPVDWWIGLSQYPNARLLSSITIKLFSISPSEICDERTASRLGWLNAARRSSITPENLIHSAKLYDYYVNGFEDGKSTHTARVHLSEPVSAPADASEPSTIIQSAPNLLDLLNETNINPRDVDRAAIEQSWFENPDPYDLSETDRVDEALQAPIISRASTTFDIDTFVDFRDPKLVSMVKRVDHDGPGALLFETDQVAPAARIVGKPGQWNVQDYIV